MEYGKFANLHFPFGPVNKQFSKCPGMKEGDDSGWIIEIYETTHDMLQHADKLNDKDHTLLGRCFVGVGRSLYLLAKSESLTVRLDRKLTDRWKAKKPLGIKILKQLTTGEADNPVN